MQREIVHLRRLSARRELQWSQDAPRGNLSQGMQLLNNMLSQRFNRRHKRVGHLWGLFGGIFGVILGVRPCIVHSFVID
jgi:hypothetical protein